MKSPTRQLSFPPVAGAEEAADDWRMLIFLHIPKTAGLNVRHVLNRQYGMDHVCVPERGEDPSTSPFWRHLEEGAPLEGRGRPGVDPNQGQREALRQRCRAEMDRIRVVMGHMWFGLHDALPRPASYFTFLRDPVERALSVYFHRVRRHGLRLGLEEYVDTARDFQMDNGQTRHLCGRMDDVDVRFTECTQEVLERAKANLRAWFPVVGITERFDESFLVMARIFGWVDPWYEPQNVNRRRPRGGQVPAAIRERLEEHNRFDTQLYAYARGLFEEQLASLDPPLDEPMVRRFRRVNALRRHAGIRRLYPLARPVLRGARSIGRTVRRVLPPR